jgi:hypothetical protein
METSTFLRKSKNMLGERLMSQLHFQKYPLFIKNLVKAADEGLLCEQNHAFIRDLLTGMSTALLKGERRRRLSNNEKTFYKMLLMYGGPMVHNFVSHNLLGASLSTSRIQLRQHSLLALNTLSTNVAAVADLLRKYNLLGVPCLLGEDGTALVQHLDPVMEQADDNSGDVLVVYGMNGGPVVVTSVDVLKDQFKAHGFATTLYVWDLIPLVDKAPHFPIKLATNANSFTHVHVLHSWKELWRICSDMGINIVGHVSDGDPKLRAADFMLQQKLRRTSGGARKYVDLPHPLIQLSVPVVYHSGVNGAESMHPVCCLQDFLHVMWRLRVLYLKPCRMLFIGPSLASPDNLRRHMAKHNTDLGLCYSDLDERDKQNFHGCLRLFGFSRLGTLQPPEDVIFGRLRADEGMLGDIMYLRFCHRFVRTFVLPTAEVSPVSSVRDMGYTITFLAVWRQLCLESDDMTLKHNFLSRETYTDVLLTAMTVVLLVKVYRDYYRDQPWVPRRFSSRFNEYIFSYMRLQMKGTPNFTALSSRRLLRNLMAQLSSEVDTNVKFPQFKRGHTRGQGRCDFDAGKQQSWPTDVEIEAALEEGMNDCIRDMSVPFHSGQSTWGLVKDKDIKKYTLFDPKSDAFWKEASETQLAMATDDELGKEYVAQLMQGYHLPNDWRKQFARHLPDQWRKQRGGTEGDVGDSDGGSDGVVGGSDGNFGGSDGGSDADIVALPGGGTSTQSPVDLPAGGTGTQSSVALFSERAAAVNRKRTADDSCSCTTHCGEDCENVLRFWECCELNCSAITCRNRLSTAVLPGVYVKECTIRAKGKGLFLKAPCAAGSCILRVTGTFRRAAPTGNSAHYTLAMRQTALPEGTQRKAPVFFTVTGKGMYINTGCTPNAEFRVVRNGRGKETVYVFLLADLLKNEEVVASYSMEEKCECLCSKCVSSEVIDLMASQSARGDAESDAESDRSDCEAVIDVTTQRSSALKFERAINKCVKVASAKVLQPTEHKQDTRSPLFIQVQQVCRTFNSHVDKQAHDRKFRFSAQLCTDAGAVKECATRTGTLSDGYVSVDNDVACLVEEERSSRLQGRPACKLYYGRIHGLLLHSDGKGGTSKVSRRVQNIVRGAGNSEAVIKWYRECGLDGDGNRILEQVDVNKQERMTTQGIICSVNLIPIASTMQPRFQVPSDAVARHERLIKEFKAGKCTGFAAMSSAHMVASRQTVSQLKEKCRSKGLLLSGNKGQLIARLADENTAPAVNRKKKRRHETSSASVTHSWGPEHMSKVRRRH